MDGQKQTNTIIGRPFTLLHGSVLSAFFSLRGNGGTTYSLTSNSINAMVLSDSSSEDDIPLGQLKRPAAVASTSSATASSSSSAKAKGRKRPSYKEESSDEEEFTDAAPPPAKKKKVKKESNGSSSSTNGNGKKKAVAVKKETNGSKKPAAAKKKAPVKRKSSTASTSTTAASAKKKGGLKEMDKAERISHAMQAYLWWNAEDPPKGCQWVTMEHAGVSFPEGYEPHGVKMLYDGEAVGLTPLEEEA